MGACEGGLWLKPPPPESGDPGEWQVEGNSCLLFPALGFSAV